MPFIVSSLFGGLSSSTLEPFFASLAMAVNSRFPVQPPSVDALIDCYHRGIINIDALDAGMSLHGAPVGTDGNAGWTDVSATLWQGVIAASWPRWDISTVMSLWAKGMLPQDDAEKALKFAGDSRGYFKDRIDYYYQSVPPSILTDWYFRGAISGKDFVSGIRKIYQVSQDDADKVLRNVNNISPPSDLVRFAVREAFDPNMVAELELGAELDNNADYLAWMQAQGYGIVNATIPGFGQYEADFAKLYWYAHWDLPSPTQGYQMLHRLRPGRVERYHGIIPGLKPVTFDDISKLLKANDYSPKWRAPLAAISYNLMTVRDSKYAFFLDKMNDAELREQLLDRGYSPEDANILFELYKEQKKEYKDKDAKRLRQAAQTRLLTALRSAFYIGAITEQQLAAGLERAKIPSDVIKIEVEAAKVKVLSKHVDTAIKSIKSEYFLGGIDENALLGELVQNGIAYDRALLYQRQWIRDFNRKRKIASTSKIIDWVLRGFIDIDEAIRRLKVMGWSNVDTLLYAFEIDDRVAERQNQLLEKMARNQQQAENAARREYDRARAAKQREIAKLMRSSSPDKMKRWYMLGLIDESTIRARLAFMEWTQSDIDRFIEQLKIEKGSGNGKGN
jgi:hypothetical protein